VCIWPTGFGRQHQGGGNRLVVDSALRIAQLRGVLKRMDTRRCWFKLGLGVLLCSAISCSEQVLPQLIAELASLDRDHAVCLRATNAGVDLILTHDGQRSRERTQGELLTPPPSQPAHVFHFMTGSSLAKQATSLTLTSARNPVAYVLATTPLLWRAFIPSLPLPYSRPPPGEVSISPRLSTLLLI
jgi:hypothetical protein